MRCISPLSIRRAGIVHVVPCGRCNFCLQTKRSDWTFRLLQENKQARSAYFLTLTYEDSLLPSEGVSKLDVQLFQKRLRKSQAKIDDARLRYYTVGEYGTETQRPHYHSIMFNLAEPVVRDLPFIWDKGMVHVGNVDIASIHYVTKYCINRVGEWPGRAPPFSLMSRRPGIGSNYLATHKSWHRSGLRNFTQVNGQKSRLPRYYKEKIFNKVERDLFAKQAVAIGDSDYLEEVSRISKFHQDPYAHYDERVAYSCMVVSSKVNKTNKF